LELKKPPDTTEDECDDDDAEAVKHTAFNQVAMMYCCKYPDHYLIL